MARIDMAPCRAIVYKAAEPLILSERPQMTGLHPISVVTQ